MKNLIAQVCIPVPKREVKVGKGNMHSYIPDLYQCCIDDAREYAANINAEYYLMNTYEWDKNFTPTYQRFALFDEKYDEYDNILYIDGDYAPVPNAPDIFELMKSREEIWFATPDNKFNKDGEMKKMRKECMDKHNIDHEFYYFNAGFFGMKREARQLVRENLSKFLEIFREVKSEMHDQDWINRIVFELMAEKYCPLSKHWNGVFTLIGSNYGTHYAGHSKRLFSIESHTQLKQKKMKRKRAGLLHVPRYSTDRINDNVLPI